MIQQFGIRVNNYDGAGGSYVFNLPVYQHSTPDQIDGMHNMARAMFNGLKADGFDAVFYIDETTQREIHL